MMRMSNGLFIKKKKETFYFSNNLRFYRLAFLCLSIVSNMSSNQQDLYRPNVSNTTIFK
jgi:hypothetical protein